MKRYLPLALVLFLIFVVYPSLTLSMSIADLISGYNFDTASGVNVTFFNDFMIDSDRNSLNDTLVVEIGMNSSSPDYIAVLELNNQGIPITNISNISGNKIFNLSISTWFLSQERFNYSIMIYDSGYNLKFKKQSIETNRYSEYETAFRILNITDKKSGNSLALNITINATKDGIYNISAFLEYPSSIITSQETVNLSGGIQSVVIFFDNETLKRTHYAGIFNISSVKIGGGIIRQDITTNEYNYTDFAQSSYIAEIKDMPFENALVLDIVTDIKGEGDYYIAFSAYDIYGNFIESKNISFYLSNGKNILHVDINGTVIYNRKIDGPYIIRGINLFENNTLIDTLRAYTTDYYSFEDFGIPPLPDINISIINSGSNNYGINNVSINITLTNTGTKTAFNLFLEAFDNTTFTDNHQILILEVDSSVVYSYDFYNISDFEISAIADIDNLIDEKNETNNAQKIPILLNTHPFLHDIESMKVNETDTIMINLSADDNAPDGLHYSINSTIFIQNNSMFEWHTTTRDSGVYTFLATVSDEYLNDTRSFEITVLDSPEKDSDNDGINESVDTLLGDSISVNASGVNLTIRVGNTSNLSMLFNGIQRIMLMDANKSLIEFDFNISNILNLSGITLYLDTSDGKNKLLVKGIPISADSTKIFYLGKTNSSINGLCISDKEISSFSEISNECSNPDEFKVECDGILQLGYNCSLEPVTGRYRISGLHHSGVVQIDYKKPVSQQDDTNSDGGIGRIQSSSRGGINSYEHHCIPEWRCNSWSECLNSLQARECKDIENCDSDIGKPILKRSCGSVSHKNENSLRKTEALKIHIANNSGIQIIGRNNPNPRVSRITGFSVFGMNNNNNNKGHLVIGVIIILMIAISAIFFYRKINRPMLSMIMLLLILNMQLISALWASYQSELSNSAMAEGVGHFPLSSANYSADFGMNFQPLAGDIDSDSRIELIIFYNSSLIVADKYLNPLANASVGNLLGEAVLFDYDNDNILEIIFNSVQGNNTVDYFSVYEYNHSVIRQEFNLSISNRANGSGIKCLFINLSSACVFIDNKNFVHIVDMKLRQDNSYPTYSGKDFISRVPAIADIDRDGNYEAVFWFDKNSDGNYGFIVFDMYTGGVDTVVDNIYSAYNVGSLRGSRLKGQPVLVALNNDEKYEIALSVFYDDSFNADTQTDWFTELFVYSHNGTKLFSKCSVGALGCNDGSSSKSRWEGTNPFVLDYDSNGADDICLIKDSKKAKYFQFMALNCYNYSGYELSNSAITSGNSVLGALTADMDSDGMREVITEYGIYRLNGSLIYAHGFSAVPPVPVDIDGNSGLDLLWSINGITKLSLDNNSYYNDIAVFESDVSFYKYNSTHINVSAVIRNIGQTELLNLPVVIFNTESLENNRDVVSIRAGGNSSFSSLLGLKKSQSVMIRVDSENFVNESDESNNFAYKGFSGLPYVYISSNIEPSKANDVIVDFIKSKLTSAYYTEDEVRADVGIYIGKNNIANRLNINPELSGSGFGYDFEGITYYDRKGVLPFNGLVGSYKRFGVTRIMIVGNEIEGTVSAVREFVSAQGDFIFAESPRALFVDNENLEAVKVYDFLHNSANLGKYMKNNEAFRNLIKNSLNSEFFTETDKNVTADNSIVLRLRNIKPEFSDELLEYINSTGVPVELPVVLGSGLWGNLSSWEILGGELASLGRDTWLIEITGGNAQECDDCSDYTFDDLTDSFVPALLNGVLNFTGSERLQYVGHSNGCRSVLSSLEKGEFDSAKVETFVGVGCPGAFVGYSDFGYYFNKYGVELLEDFRDNNHLSMSELGGTLKRECGIDLLCKLLTRGLVGSNKISYNLSKQYYLWINGTSDEQIGRNVKLDNFYLIEGWVFSNTNSSHDFMVTSEDQRAIYSNINISKNKRHYKLWGAHTAGWNLVSLPMREISKSIIKDSFNKKPLDKYKSNEISSTERTEIKIE